MTRNLPVVSRPLRYAVVAACALLIVAASVVDPGDGPSSTLFGVGTTVPLHFVAYAGLAGAAGYARLAADARTLLAVAFVTTAYGAGVELLQGQLSYRTMSAFDALVNGAGALVGALLWRAVEPWFDANGGATRLSGSTR